MSMLRFPHVKPSSLWSYSLAAGSPSFILFPAKLFQSLICTYTPYFPACASVNLWDGTSTPLLLLLVTKSYHCPLRPFKLLSRPEPPRSFLPEIPASLLPTWASPPPWCYRHSPAFLHLLFWVISSLPDLSWDDSDWSSSCVLGPSHKPAGPCTWVSLLAHPTNLCRSEFPSFPSSHNQQLPLPLSHIGISISLEAHTWHPRAIFAWLLCLTSREAQEPHTSLLLISSVLTASFHVWPLLPLTSVPAFCPLPPPVPSAQGHRIIFQSFIQICQSPVQNLQKKLPVTNRRDLDIYLVIYNLKNTFK